MDGITYEEEELHNDYFYPNYDGYSGQTQDCRDDIDKIRRNDPTLTEFTLSHANNYFDKMNWKLLGRYIIRNTHLISIDFTELYASKESLSYFFSEMPQCSLANSLQRLDLEGFNTDLFESMVRALDGGPIENIMCERGDIDNIAVLGEVELPRLHHLDLSDNKVVQTSGLEKCLALRTLWMGGNPISSAAGCIGICKLLESSTALLEFTMCRTSIGDEVADMMANSLRHNKTLYLLEMEENQMTEKGCLSFLTLICGDITSIESTYTSNHIISTRLPLDDDHMIKKYIDSSSQENGRTKVINLQLNNHIATTVSLLK